MEKNETVKEYLSRIGKKGGKASSAVVDTKKRAMKAAKARWAKRQQKQKDSS